MKISLDKAENDLQLSLTVSWSGRSSWWVSTRYYLMAAFSQPERWGMWKGLKKSVEDKRSKMDPVTIAFLLHSIRFLFSLHPHSLLKIRVQIRVPNSILLLLWGLSHFSLLQFYFYFSWNITVLMYSTLFHLWTFYMDFWVYAVAVLFLWTHIWLYKPFSELFSLITGVLTVSMILILWRCTGGIHVKRREGRTEIRFLSLQIFIFKVLS